jgi:hypothetical protein
VTDIIGTGIAFPLRVDQRGGLALASGDEDVKEAIRIVIGTAPGDFLVTVAVNAGTLTGIPNNAVFQVDVSVVYDTNATAVATGYRTNRP